MKIFEEIYYKLRNLMSKPGERGESSAGYLQDKIRQTTLEICCHYTGRLLEIGCGEGLLLSQLARYRPNLALYGVDNSFEMLSRAEEIFKKNSINNICLKKTDAQKLPFEDAFFDSVLCVNVFICIRSINEVRAVLTEAARVCKQGGRLVVEFRNKDNPLLQLKYKFAKYYDATVVAQGHPLSTYTSREISELLCSLGFKRLQERRVGFPLKSLSPVIIIEAEKI